MHFACRLYNELDEIVDQDVIHEMVSDAVALEQAFFACTYNFVARTRRTLKPAPAALPNGLSGLNATLMGQYVEYVADFLLWKLGVSTMYGQTNPVRIPSCKRERRTNIHCYPTSSPSWRVPPSQLAPTSSIARFQTIMVPPSASTWETLTNTNQAGYWKARRHHQHQGVGVAGHAGIVNVEDQFRWTHAWSDSYDSHYLFI